jgi:hypothetical protein
MDLPLSLATMDALGFSSYGNTDETLLLAFHDPVQYSSAYVVRCILLKKFPLLLNYVVEAHHEPGRILVRCHNNAVVRRLHAKYIRWGDERASFFKVATISPLRPDPLEEDLPLERF